MVSLRYVNHKDQGDAHVGGVVTSCELTIGIVWIIIGSRGAENLADEQDRRQD